MPSMLCFLHSVVSHDYIKDILSVVLDSVFKVLIENYCPIQSQLQVHW